MNIFKKAAHVISWPLIFAIRLVLIIAGLFIVPLAILLDFPRWLWVYGNYEEGCPNWWLGVAQIKGGVIGLFPRWWWYAVRNPINNFRYLFKDYPLEECETQTNWDRKKNGQMEAGELIAAGQQSAYLWAAKGWKAGYRKIWLNGEGKYSEVWLGWKIGSPVQGCGFTSQIRLRVDVGQ